MAFHIAGSMAFKGAMQKANPVLLEPKMCIRDSVEEDTSDIADFDDSAFDSEE